MNQNKSSTQQRTSEEVKHGVIYLGADPSNCIAIRPNPPTPEMVARAQPYRADTLQAMEAVIKIGSTFVDV